MADKSEQVKTIEDIIAGYEDWLKKYGSMGYMSSEGREGHIKEQLKQLAKTNYDVYTAMLDSIAHGKIEVSDDLKGIFNEFIKQRETEGKSRTNRGKLYEVVDKDLRALKTPEDKKAFANRLEAYARQNGYANDYYKTAVVLVASKEYSEDVENMVRDVQKKTNERTNTEEKVQQPIDNLTREQADVMLRGLPSPLSDEQKRVFTGFLKGASREDDPSHKIYLAVLDLVNNPETAKNYSDEVKNLVKESAKKQEHTTDNNISFGNTAATNHSRTSDNSGSAGGNMTLSANMDYALKMGPTVLKEELEGMGYKFDASMIRHGAKGDYIPTRLLKQWFQENQLSVEQINKLNALVDDRAAFNAKVKKINDRDEYVATTPQAETVREEEAAAVSNARTNSGADKGGAEEQLKGMGVNTGNEFNLGQMLNNVKEMKYSTDFNSQKEQEGLQNVEQNSKREEDLAAARELLKKDPKEFMKKIKTHEKAGETYDLKVMSVAANEVKQETKETAQRDKENAEAKADREAKRAQKAIEKAAKKAEKAAQKAAQKAAKKAEKEKNGGNIFTAEIFSIK